MASALRSFVLARRQQRAEASKVAKELEKRAERTYTSPFAIALSWAGLGDTDRAVTWLQRAHESRDSRLVGVVGYPEFDSIRTNREFQRLVQRLGLVR